MPITCEIELHCTAAKAPDVIREAMMGVIASAAVQIKLPTGYVMKVPVTWVEGTRRDLPKPLTGGIPQEFLFPVDKQIRAFCRQHDLLNEIREYHGRERAKISFLILDIVAGMQFACVQFGAPNRTLSNLLVESRAIRGYFLNVLRQAGGLAGGISCGSYFHLLDDPRRVITEDVGRISASLSASNKGRSAQAFDRYVEELLVQIGEIRRSG
jgi:hypothetical protein